MNQPVFSIIILSYNQSSLVSKAIESCLVQKYTDYEIIIVDDCSSDDSISVINSFKNKCENITLIAHPKNLSSHASRCSGVEAARGKYILFLDGDDTFCENAFQTIYDEIIAGENFDVCEFAYRECPRGKIVYPSNVDKEKSRFDYFKTGNAAVTVWNKVYSASVVKEAFQNMKRNYLNCGDDVYESLCIAYFTKHFKQSDRVCVNYNIGIGVSTKRHNYEDNLKNAVSLRNVLDEISYFVVNIAHDDPNLFLIHLEKDSVLWLANRFYNATESSDAVKSLLILPKYFSVEACEIALSPIYEKSKRYDSGYFSVKKLIKRFLPKSLLNFYNKL